ncbi:MAG TPA: hypothetical protein VHV82_02810 [Sporichthyaceae bacterium]|nr:hypothetical protein [Sporichthyaceae bacterium]
MAIEKVVRKMHLHDRDDSRREYWLTRPVQERLAHVQELRAECYGWADRAGPRLPRVHRLLHRQ